MKTLTILLFTIATCLSSQLVQADTQICSFSGACNNLDMSFLTNVKCITAGACTGTATYMGKSDLVIDCGPTACNGLIVQSTGHSSLTINCQSSSSCRNMLVTSSGGGPDKILCDGLSSCENAAINTDSSIQLSCKTDSSCTYMNIQSTGATNFSLSCETTNACTGSTITSDPQASFTCVSGDCSAWQRRIQ